MEIYIPGMSTGTYFHLIRCPQVQRNALYFRKLSTDTFSMNTRTVDANKHSNIPQRPMRTFDRGEEEGGEGECHPDDLNKTLLIYLNPQFSN